MDSVKYPNNRHAYVYESSGYVKIVPDDYVKSIDLFCNVCDTAIRSFEDESSCIEFDCCYKCALTWAHPRRELWKSGWRPTTDEINRVVAERPGLSFTLQVD